MNSDRINILAIETSCDETAISIVEATSPRLVEDGVGGGDSPNFKILGNTVASQADLHATYGGVFPMMAKREHSKNIVPVLIETLRAAYMYDEFKTLNTLSDEVVALLNREPELLEICKEYLPHISKPNIDAIVVTSGPGLEPALWVGINFAKVLGTLWNIPVVPINHMEGHIMSPLLDSASSTNKVTFPALALLISGGHTELVVVNNWMDYKKIGQTRDDAVGEAFDKVARMMDLPYPGGPHISRLAAEWRNMAISPLLVEEGAGGGDFTDAPPRPAGTPPQQGGDIRLPRPMLHSNDYDFSFSGLKTAVLYAIQDIKKDGGTLTDEIKKQIACEFENAATDVLQHKTFKAIDEYGIQTLLIGGGVAANKFIKKSFLEKQNSDYPYMIILFPEKDLSTDNALMIAIAGYFRYQKIMAGNKKFPLDFTANGNWNVSS